MWRIWIWVAAPVMLMWAEDNWHFLNPPGGTVALMLGLAAAGLLTALDSGIAKLIPATPLQVSRSKMWITHEKIKTCSDALSELEQHAKITEAVERANSGPMPLFIANVAPFGTEDRRRQLELEIDHGQRSRNRTLRNAYFSVTDLELRKQLISKTCELDELIKLHSKYELDLAQATAAEANATFEKARAASQSWLIWACILGIGFVFGGSVLFRMGGFNPQLGAVAGALVALLAGRQMEQDSKRRIAGAAEAQERASADLNERLKEPSEPPLFSPEETRTGQIASARLR